MTASDTKIYSGSDIGRMVAAGDHLPTASHGREPDPELDDAFWNSARVVVPDEAPVVAILVPLDPDVLAWFNEGGEGYLSRMSAVLRAYVNGRKPPHA